MATDNQVSQTGGEVPLEPNEVSMDVVDNSLSSNSSPELRNKEYEIEQDVQLKSVRFIKRDEDSLDTQNDEVTTNGLYEIKEDGERRKSESMKIEDEETLKKPTELDTEERVVNTSPTGRFVRYETEIGRGSFKTVYKGLDTETGVAVAWCELQEHKFNKAEQIRFKDEVAILKTLNHPYILRLFDSFEFVRQTDKKRILVLITELMTSGTLKSYMRRLKSIKLRVIRSWGRQILKGLHFLHTRTPPIIHRDLKCDNVFINGTTGLVKIGDLGLATLKRSDVKTVIGTPEFMAPEMYDEVYDESVDVYAFGMCLLEMCTREYPYQECRNPAQIFKKVTSGIRPQSLDKVGDPMLKDIIEGCTKLAKSERFTVRQLLDHEFFAEGDVKVEMMPETAEQIDKIMFRMEVPNRENRKNGQESIEFSYNLETDVPENVVDEMIKSGILREEDKKYAIRSMREFTDVAKQKRQQQQLNTGVGGASVGVNPVTTTGLLKEGTTVDDKPPSILTTDLSTTLETELHNPPPKLLHQLSNTSDDSTTEPVKLELEKVTGSMPSTEAPSSNGGSPNITHSTKTVDTVIEEDSESGGEGGSEDGEAGRVIVTEEQSKILKPVESNINQSTTSSIALPSLSKDGSEDKPEDETGRQEVVTVSDNISPQETTPINNSSTTEQKESTKITGSTTTTSQPQSQTAETQSQSLVIQSQISMQTSDATSESGGGANGGGGGGVRKKPRVKEPKKGLKLKLTEKVDNVVSCSLVTSSGQMINFRFSLDYDKPREIFQNLLKAGHLTSNEEEEFIQQSSLLVDRLRKGDSISEAQKSVDNQPTIDMRKHRSLSNAKPDSAEPKRTTSVEGAKEKLGRSISDGVSQALPAVNKKETPPLNDNSSSSPLPRKKFVVTDVTTDKQVAITSQSSAESISSAGTPIHVTEETFGSITTSPPPPGSTPSLITTNDNTSTNDKITNFLGIEECTLPTNTTTQSTCPITLDSSSLPIITSDVVTQSSITGMTSIVSSSSSAPPSVVSSATSSCSNLQNAGGVTTSVVTVGDSRKTFEIEDVLDISGLQDDLSCEGSTDSLSDSQQHQQEPGLQTPESQTSTKDGDSGGVVSHSGLESLSSQSIQSDPPQLSNDEVTPSYSQIDGVSSHTTLTSPPIAMLAPLTQQPTLHKISQPQMQPPVTSIPLYVSPSVQPLPSMTNFPNHNLLEEGFAKFLYYMKLMLQDPCMNELLHQLETYFATSGQSPVHTMFSTNVSSTTHVPPTQVPSSDVPVAQSSSSNVPSTYVQWTHVPPTQVPSSDVPVPQASSSNVPSTYVQWTHVPPTQVPLAHVPPTQVPLAHVPSTQVPLAHVPSTAPSHDGYQPMAPPPADSDHNECDTDPSFIKMLTEIKEEEKRLQEKKRLLDQYRASHRATPNSNASAYSGTAGQSSFTHNPYHMIPTTSSVMSSGNPAHNDREQLRPYSSNYFHGVPVYGASNYSSLNAPPEPRETVLPRSSPNNPSDTLTNRLHESRSNGVYYGHLNTGVQPAVMGMGPVISHEPHTMGPPQIYPTPLPNNDWPQQYRMHPTMYSSSSQTLLPHHVPMVQQGYQSPVPPEGGMSSPNRLDVGPDYDNTMTTQKR